MRIIAGQWGGRRLSAPKGKVTRPTPDRVRESLFSILGDRVEGARVLDLFAGTGCLGLECLSRGAAHGVFVEKDRQVFTLLAENLQIAPPERYQTLNSPAARALRHLQKVQSTFDIVFLDPPYHLGLLQPTFTTLLESGMVESTGTVVCEHYSKDEPPAPSEPWSLIRTRQFGEVSISLFQVPSLQEKEAP